MILVDLKSTADCGQFGLTPQYFLSLVELFCVKIKGAWFLHYFNFNSHHRPDVLSVYVGKWKFIGILIPASNVTPTEFDQPPFKTRFLTGRMPILKIQIVPMHFQNLLPTEGLIYKSVTSAVACNSKVLTITDAISDDCKRFSGL